MKLPQRAVRVREYKKAVARAVNEMRKHHNKNHHLIAHLSWKIGIVRCADCHCDVLSGPGDFIGPLLWALSESGIEIGFF